MISILLPTYNRKKLLYQTLRSYDYFYHDREDLEIVIVDDCSNKENQFPNVQEDFPRLNITSYRIGVKCGYNPSLAYNVAARKAKGDIFVLTSPETFHVTDMFRLCDEFKDFKKDDYYLFSVFCLTQSELKEQISHTEDHKDIVNIIESLRLCENLGEAGCEYGNNLGNWYLHEKYKPSKLNFLTALSRDLYYEISGFNEEFMQGTGYDDADFLARLSPYISQFHWFDSNAIHIDHDLAEKIPQNSNETLFMSLQQNQTYSHNDNWGDI